MLDDYNKGASPAPAIATEQGVIHRLFQQSPIPRPTSGDRLIDAGGLPAADVVSDSSTVSGVLRE